MKVRSRYKHSQENDEGSWAISYGDMVTLLLSFFVLFFSIDFKKGSEKVLDNSLQGIFSLQSIAVKENQLMIDQKKVNQKAIENILQGVFKTTFVEEKIKQDIVNASSELIKNDQSMSEVNFQIDGMNMVKVKDGTFVLFFRGVSFFKSSKYDITDKGIKSLKEFTEKFIPMSGKYKIRVQAYTDNRLVKNDEHRTFRDNLELSVLRSLSVVRKLNENGIPSRRVEISGKGEMSDRINKLLYLDKVSKKEKEELSRTISLVISRDEDLK